MCNVPELELNQNCTESVETMHMYSELIPRVKKNITATEAKSYLLWKRIRSRVNTLVYPYHIHSFKKKEKKNREKKIYNKLMNRQRVRSYT